MKTKILIAMLSVLHCVTFADNWGYACRVENDSNHTIQYTVQYRYSNSGGSGVLGTDYAASQGGFGVVSNYAYSQYINNASHIDSTISIRLSVTGYGDVDIGSMSAPDGFSGTLDCGLWVYNGSTFTNGSTPCTTNLTWNIKNNDMVAHTYFTSFASTRTSTYYQTLSGLDLGPGSSGVLKWYGYCSNAADVIIVIYTGGEMGANQGGTWVEGNGGQIGSGVPPTGSAGTGNPVTNGVASPISPVTPPQYNSTNNAYSGTNSPIVFSGTNTAQSTLEGLGAIYTAVNKHGDQAHTDQKALLDQIKNIYNGVTGIYTNAQAVSIANQLFLSNSIALAGMNNASFISNALKGGLSITGLVSTVGTNGITQTNLATVNFQAAMSNLLNQQLSWMTNSHPLSSTDVTNSSMFENISNMLQQGMSTIADGTNRGAGMMKGAFDGLGGAGLFPTHSVDETGAGSVDFAIVALNGAVNLHFGTTAIDAAFPSLANARPIYKWCIFLLLAIMNYLVMMKILRNTVLVPQARTTGQSVLGTNLNLPSAIAMAAAIVAICAAIPTVCAQGILLAMNNVTWGNPVAGVASVATAYQFCEHYFPITLMVTALLNHLGFRFFANSLEGVGYGIIKFLVGL